MFNTYIALRMVVLRDLRTLRLTVLDTVCLRPLLTLKIDITTEYCTMLNDFMYSI